jgi:small subunit ribosomal protein S1
VDEKLEFKVIEFNKSAKRIVLSHTRIFEDKQRKTEVGSKRTAETDSKRTARKLKSSIEKTTLGDISELAALKTEMEQKEKKTKEDSTKNK